MLSPVRLGVIGVSAPLLLGVSFLTADALQYRAAIRQAASDCASPVATAKLIDRFDRPTPHLYRPPHAYLATRLTDRRSRTAVNALHRAYRAQMGPILVSRAEAAGAFCALAPKRELPA